MNINKQYDAIMNPQKKFTKKDLIKILEKMDSERTKQNLKEYSVKDKELND